MRPNRSGPLLAVLLASLTLGAGSASASPTLSVARAKTAILKVETAYWHRHGEGLKTKLTIRFCKRSSATVVRCQVNVAGPFGPHESLTLTDTAALVTGRTIVHYGPARLT